MSQTIRFWWAAAAAAFSLALLMAVAASADYQPDRVDPVGWADR